LSFCRHIKASFHVTGRREKGFEEVFTKFIPKKASQGLSDSIDDEGYFIILKA
jgi:hypothetical protein